jgi:DNA repair exonuclease SbcCD ATPase subunit
LKITKIELENYKGTKKLSHELFDRTVVCGKNATGKTTLMDAFFDIITGKLADGTAPDAIRPHDADGKDIDRVAIKRSITIDGDELTKVTEQKWRKPRGQVDEVLDGNVTTYQINGFDKKKKDFDDKLSEIADPDTLLLCSNAKVFTSKLRKSTAEARKYIESLSGFSVDKFIQDHDEYKDVLAITDGNPVEDVVKKLKKELSLEKKEGEKISNNLQYVSERVFPFDTAANQKKISDAEQLLATVERQKIVRADAATERTISAEKLNGLYTEKNRLEESLKAVLSKAKAEYDKSMAESLKNAMSGQQKAEKAQHDVSLCKGRISDLYTMAVDANDSYKKVLASITECEKKIADIEAETFSGSDTCPTCGQKLPKGKIDSAIAKFEDDKKTRTDFYRNAVSEKKADAEALDKKRHEYKLAWEQAKKDLIPLEKALEEAKTDVKDYDVNYPEFDDSEIKNSDEYKEGEAKIAEISEKIAELKTKISAELPNVDIALEKDAKESLESARKEYAVWVETVKTNEAEVESLTKKMREQGQKIADIEQKITLIQNFSIEKNKEIEKIVNGFFKKVSFKFFDTTYEGNVYETLRIMVNGTDYMNGLNHGDRILADIDLVTGFQKMNNLNIPVWVDDVESLDADRIPEIDQQLIMLRVTEDKELVIKEA